MTYYGRIDYGFITLEIDCNIRSFHSGSALIEYVLPVLSGTNFKSRSIRSFIVGDFISTKYAQLPAHKVMVF